MKVITAEDVRADVRSYLEGWFNKAKARQERKGKTFNLTFGDFLNLWGARRLRTLEKWMDEGSLFVRNRRPTKEDPNLNGYVLSPVSFAATQQSIYDASNMQICTRGTALYNCRMKKGDRHSEASKRRISQTTTGRPKTDEHKANIAASMKGKNRREMTDEQKAIRAESARKYWARKRAEKDGDA